MSRKSKSRVQVARQGSNAYWRIYLDGKPVQDASGQDLRFEKLSDAKWLARTILEQLQLANPGK